MTNLISKSDSHYDIWWVESAGMPCNHVAIFAETHELGPGSGHNYQVSGNIQMGMYCSYRPGAVPEEDEQSAFFSKTMLGRVARVDYDNGRFKQICDEIEVPKKQFQGPKRLFPNTKLRRCGEWAAEAAEKLRQEGVLVPQPEA